jgi:dTDP-4-dehydrorhamnose reductase
MKIAVIGANGQLGSDIYEELKDNIKGDIIGLTHSDMDIADIDSVYSVFNNTNPDIIINTAAFHNVPLCEKEREKAYAVNSNGAENLAKISSEIKSKLIHFSTDYVFDGEKESPYIESDLPNPLNIYAKSKLEGENRISDIAEKYYILRVAGLYGKYPSRVKGYNFVELMLRLAKERDEIRVVDDEITTPTYTKEIGKQILKIIKKEPEYGIYHATAEGECSWYEFAKTIFEFAGVKVNLKKAFPEEFASDVNRPKYSVLENHKLKKEKLNIFKNWQQELKDYLNIIF